MRHRSLENSSENNDHSDDASDKHHLSLRSNYQLTKPRASIEAGGLFLEINSNNPSDIDIYYGNHSRNPDIILIIEDDNHTSRLNRSILEDVGYSVACVGSGEEALNMLTATTPSLVLLDVILPAMDGFATFEKIRENSEVPIIFVSAEDSDEDMIRGLEMGADDYITKPFSTCELSARVRAVLRRYECERRMGLTADADSSGPDMSFLDELKEPVRISTSEISMPDAEDPETETADPSVDDVASDSEVSTDGISAVIADPATELKNYEGAVKLVVETAGAITNLVRFVSTLRENPQFHLLRVVSNPKRDGMDVLLRLRGPNPLRTTLLAADGVSQVEPLEDNDTDSETVDEMPVFKVSLY